MKFLDFAKISVKENYREHLFCIVERGANVVGVVLALTSNTFIFEYLTKERSAAGPNVSSLANNCCTKFVHRC